MPDPTARERLSRALGLAQSLAQARGYPVSMDGVHDVAAEIVTLIESYTQALGGEGERDAPHRYNQPCKDCGGHYRPCLCESEHPRSGCTPCTDCGRDYYDPERGAFWVSDELWALVVGDDTIALCPRCFVNRADVKLSAQGGLEGTERLRQIIHGQDRGQECACVLADLSYDGNDHLCLMHAQIREADAILDGLANKGETKQ